ncbi:Exostosin family protein [Melia azedarach]|uniref:Exostosin family protein n=1 Tax=Melia azedarach TaxID=155640 RepID=A0ACC1WP15_MELAZ|nr:Exostosin family protein [Melia azedarach]
MGSLHNNKSRIFTPYNHTPCTRTHQIGALLLVTTTFFLTRLFDQSFSPCHYSSLNLGGQLQQNLVRLSDGGRSLSWPERGDGTISADSCLQSQWGTQVKIHKLLLQSRFRTGKKEEADLFFVPAYPKCVRMMGGLNDKEINQTYVKVLSQMPYFRRSGGRDHIFVFPSGAGAHLFRSWATYINRSIILTPEGD